MSPTGVGDIFEIVGYDMCQEHHRPYAELLEINQVVW